MLKAQEMVKEEALTDFTIRVGSKTYQSHRLILAAHSDYFYRLLLSGMREAEEGLIVFKNMETEVFDIIFEYIYNGQLSSEVNDDVLSEVYFAANMLQIDDLESEVVQVLMAKISPENCFEMRTRLNKICALETSLRAKEQKLFEDLDEFIQNCIKDRWRLVSESPGFLELDIDSLCQVLDVKLTQEEIADFSYSFNQADIAEGVVNWVDYDLCNRFYYIRPRLASYFCLHQTNITVHKTVIALYQVIQTKLSEKAIAIPSEFSEWAWYQNNIRTSDDVCQGRFCPHRAVEGLVISSARTPSTVTCINSEHSMYHFVIPKVSDSTMWDQSELLIQLGKPYLLQQGVNGNIGEGERLYILPNSLVPLRNSTYMVMSRNENRLWGNLLDPLQVNHECEHHHLSFYRFCPTNFLACNCTENHWAFCSDSRGYIYVMTSCPSTREESSASQYDPCCSTYKLLKSPIAMMGSSIVARAEDNETVVFVIGGYTSRSGNDVSIVTPSQKLRKSAVRSGGHTHITTELVTFSHALSPNREVFQFTESKGWTTWNECLPFEVCDAALLSAGHYLYVIGGCVSKYCSDQQLYYLEPQTTVWIYNMETLRWSQGPELPDCPKAGIRGYARGSAYLINNGREILYSGGVQLKYNEPEESNQIFEYVSNTKAFKLDITGAHEWTTILDISSLGKRSKHFTVFGILPGKIKLPRFRVSRGGFVSLPL